MQVAGYTLTLINFGSFRLDGGAMFGSVPKNLWSKRIPADEENRIQLVSRSILLRGNGRVVLIDVGMGDKWDDKSKKIFAIENTPRSSLPFKDSEITDVVLTHLHFDHGGGITKLEGDKSVLTYPQATVHLQRANWENAQKPNLRERASYLPENVEPLKTAKLNLVSGSTEIVPGIFGHQVDGHTKGQQWLEVRDDKTTVMFTTDLIPTAHHLPLPFTMGYDICALTVISEREQFLRYALERNAVVVFQHDADTPAARLRAGAKYAEVAERLEF